MEMHTCSFHYNRLRVITLWAFEGIHAHLGELLAVMRHDALMLATTVVK